MSLEATHPLPARNLIYDIAVGHMAVEDDHDYQWGPWICQGYGWCTGFLVLTAGGAGVSTFNVYQGFEDRNFAAAPPAPPFGRWALTDTFAINANTVYTWKIQIVSTAIYFQFLERNEEDGWLEITSFLRND